METKKESDTPWLKPWLVASLCRNSERKPFRFGFIDRSIMGAEMLYRAI